MCPSELRVGDGDACKSACEAFGTPEYCCSGALKSTPMTATPSQGAATAGSNPGFAYSDSGAGSGSGSASGMGTGTGTVPGSGSGAGEAMLADDGSWLAGLAMGDSNRARPLSMTSAALCIIFSYLFL
ncbi:hypothetical protein ACE6H2_027717 [Prunus campanulata]